MIKPVLRNQDGYTAVELLVVMTILGLAVSFGYTGYRAFQQNLLRWQSRTALETQTNIAMRALTSELRFARQVTKVRQHAIHFVDLSGRLVMWETQGDNILKNGHKLLPAGQRGELSFTYFDDTGIELDLFAGPEEIQQIQVAVNLIGDRTKRFSMQRHICLRNIRVLP